MIAYTYTISPSKRGLGETHLIASDYAARFVCSDHEEGES